MQVRTLGGDATHVKLAAIGYGAMNLSWNSAPPPDEQAFACINAAVDALPSDKDVKVLVNLGVFYSGKPGSPENLKLFRRYMDAHPDKVERIAISIKGGMGNGGYDLTKPDSSIENLRQELKMCKEVLGPKKVIDLYEPARRDRSLSVEQIVQNLKTCIDEGLFSHISLSEVGAETIRTAAKIHPIAAVEVEYNPFELSIESNDVLQACKDNKIAIIAYSPVGRGFFTHTFKSRDQIPPGDPRLHGPRFSEENFPLNLKLVEEFEAIAREHKIPANQLVMAWELSQYEKLVPIPGSTNPDNVRSNMAAASVQLDAPTIKKIRDYVQDVEKKVNGTRYPEPAMKATFG